MTTNRLIYGTAWKKENTTGLVKLAWENGFRAFDTACQPKHYREDLVGTALADITASGVKREEFYIQTKYTPEKGQDPSSIPYDKNLTITEQVRESFSVSLQNLQVDYLDALILHSPIAPLGGTMEAWQAMEDLHTAGKVKTLGISNCYDINLFEYLHENASIKPGILQNRFYDQTGYDKSLRYFCAKHNIHYQSFWTLTANPHILDNPAIQLLSKQYHRTSAQILFRYLTQQGITPLTGTTDNIHMREDLAIFEFELKHEELNEIGQLL